MKTRGQRQVCPYVAWSHTSASGSGCGRDRAAGAGTPAEPGQQQPSQATRQQEGGLGALLEFDSVGVSNSATPWCVTGRAQLEWSPCLPPPLPPPGWGAPPTTALSPCHPNSTPSGASPTTTAPFPCTHLGSAGTVGRLAAERPTRTMSGRGARLTVLPLPTTCSAFWAKRAGEALETSCGARQGRRRKARRGDVVSGGAAQGLGVCEPCRRLAAG